MLLFFVYLFTLTPLSVRLWIQTQCAVFASKLPCSEIKHRNHCNLRTSNQVFCVAIFLQLNGFFCPDFLSIMSVQSVQSHFEYQLLSSIQSSTQIIRWHVNSSSNITRLNEPKECDAYNKILWYFTTQITFNQSMKN